MSAPHESLATTPSALPRPHQATFGDHYDDTSTDHGVSGGGNLFNVIPPDGVRSSLPAAEDDLRWYRDLRCEIAEILVRVVTRAYTAQGRPPNVGDCRKISREIRHHADVVSRTYLAGDPPPVLVSEAVNDLARRFGLITTITHIGPRYYDYCGTGETFTFDDALEIADLALRGQWPEIREHDGDVQQGHR